MSVSGQKPPPPESSKARKIKHIFGFTKTYNLILFTIFSLALLGFCLARSPYLSYNGIYCSTNSTNTQLHAAPGECYYYNKVRHMKVGIIMHLICIVVLAPIVILQFVPIIRQKCLLYHRIAGYAAIILLLGADVGALMVMRRAFGGSLSTQIFVVALAAMTIASVTLAYVNIRRLQIDQHRAWMLRTWFYMGTPITQRLILFITAITISKIGGYTLSMPCEKIVSILNNDGAKAVELYPACVDISASAAINASMLSGAIVELTAALNSSFGAASWLALLLHAFGIETYLHLTQAEGERLKQVSYEKQLAAGMRNAGFAGLTRERLGDAVPFVPRKSSTAEIEEHQNRQKC